MECQKCFLTINCKIDLFTVCDGTCCRSFHAACVGLSEASVSCLKKNTIWLCDDCLSAFYEYVQKNTVGLPEPDNAPTKVDAEIADIKEKIVYIMEALTTISDAQKQSHQCTPRHSTPIHSPTLHEGSRTNKDYSSSENSMPATPADSVCHKEGTFSLFLTNIDAHVTEEEISDMVSRSLRVEENAVINVKKLVPKWKANDTLSYASFKIQMDERLKLVALREDSWPAGIMFREFIERRRTTWKPSRCNTTLT